MRLFISSMFAETTSTPSATKRFAAEEFVSRVTATILNAGYVFPQTFNAMSDQKKRIIVLGATGNQGGAVVRALKAYPEFKIVAVTRDTNSSAAKRFVADGVDVVSANMDDMKSLMDAFEGAYGVFSVQNFYLPGVGFQGEMQQGKFVAFAAKQCHVKHLVYSSVASADIGEKWGIDHFHSKFEIEEYIRGLNIPHSIVRPAAFFDSRLDKNLKPTGTTVVGITKPETKMQYVAVEDIGFFAALMFAEGPEKWNGKILELAGDNLDGIQVTKDFSEHLQRPLQYKALPGWLVRLFIGKDIKNMADFFEAEGYKVNIDELKKLHPGLMDHKTWLKKYFPVEPVAASSCNIL
eukprot:TRINITY_DN7254_c0_g1_i1.p1 TRINITY_DN7254_c0_g1~~TRINITY_DN7254_c0_g1_i1.p1  ORF type:complete len:350 (+),score=96.19 TRINITY_DN7254_c0_g1_i1:767-1816(+)